MEITKNPLNSIRIKLIVKVLIYLFIFLVGIFVSQLLIGILPLAKNVSMTFVVLTMNITTLLTITFFTFIFRIYIDKKSFLSMGFGLKNFNKRFWLGSLLAIIILTIGFILLLLLQQIKIENSHYNPEYLISAIFMCIVTAIVEEMAFRGYILSNLMNNFNKFCALLISSILFSLPHIFNNEITFLSTLNIFLAGVLLGLTFIYTQNLWFPIGFHLFWNLTQGLLGYSVSGGDMPSILILKYPTKNILNGGDFGFEGSIICTLLLTVGILYIYFFLEKRERKIPEGR